MQDRTGEFSLVLVNVALLCFIHPLLSACSASVACCYYCVIKYEIDFYVSFIYLSF